MGYPGKKRKSYNTPKHPWKEARMASEVELIKACGLRNKREVWKAESMLRKYRSDARRLLARMAAAKDLGLTGHDKVEADQILGKLIRYGVLSPDSKIDDILGLKTENILERRLQTQVLRLGLARTIRQARQFITHGHISVNGRKATVPSMFIAKEDEMNISYYVQSPLVAESHSERPAQIASALVDGTLTLKAYAAAKKSSEADRRPAKGRGRGRRRN